MWQRTIKRLGIDIAKDQVDRLCVERQKRQEPPEVVCGVEGICIQNARYPATRVLDQRCEGVVGFYDHMGVEAKPGKLGRHPCANGMVGADHQNLTPVPSTRRRCCGAPGMFAWGGRLHGVYLSRK